MKVEVMEEVKVEEMEEVKVEEMEEVKVEDMEEVKVEEMEEVKVARESRMREDGGLRTEDKMILYYQVHQKTQPGRA